MKRFGCFLFVSTCMMLVSTAQKIIPYVSKVWVADMGDGRYQNPVLHADYSDPDVIRVGNDYYLIASSFNAAPGLPILHSNDLVNWSIIGHAFNQQFPIDHFRKVQHYLLQEQLYHLIYKKYNSPNICLLGMYKLRPFLKLSILGFLY